MTIHNLPTGERRVAVTGGAGFIGSHTVEQLITAGWRVLVIDDMSHPCPEPLPGVVEVLAADCGSSSAVESLRRFRPEAVLHLAAKGGVNRALRDPGAHVQAGLASTVNLFNAAGAAGARVLATASSGGAVYGEPPALPATEDMPAAPRSPYGAGKASEEIYLGCFQRLLGIETAVALRYANVYGPRQDGTGEAGVVAITSWRLQAGESPVIYGDGEQTRDFVYVDDVARANVAAVSSRQSGPINVGTGRETSVRRVVELLGGLHGGGLHAIHAAARGGEIRRSLLDSRRAEQWWGWQACTGIEDGLADTYRYFAQSVTAGA